MADKLIKLTELQSYITKTIDLVKNNFSKRNETLTNVELVKEQLSGDTEPRNYLKFYYVDDTTAATHFIHIPLYTETVEEEKEEKELLELLKNHEVEVGFLENAKISNADGTTSDNLKYNGKLLLTEDSDLGTSVEEWVASQEYVQGDLVIHNKKFYRCVVTTSNKTTFDESDFELIGGSEVELDMFVVKNYSSLPAEVFTKEKIAHVLEDEGDNLKGLYVYDVTNNAWNRSVDEEAIHDNREVLDKLLDNADNRLVFDSKVIAYQEDIKSILEEYEPSKAYEEGIIVIFNNKIYKCIQSPQTDSTQITDQDWIEISANYEIATEGEDLDFTTNWWE